MQFIIDFIQNFWHLSLMIGLYVIFGLLFVGVVHLYVSDEFIKKHLGYKSRYATIKGALYGIPLPLCSCGVIPLATSLRKKGASKKAITSFFITTPMTGVDSIFATYGAFGLPMAVLRVLSSFISGVFAGSLVKDDNEQIIEEEEVSCCSSKCCSAHSHKTQNRFIQALDYSINEVFADIAKPMLYGLVLATLFMMFIPEDGVKFLNENVFVAYMLVFLVALPVYVCSLSAIPIALSMLLVGVTPGVAFIFLAAAPATNIITVGVIKKILGSSVLLAYLFSIISVTLVFALAIDFVLPAEWFTYILPTLEAESASWLDIGGAVLFLTLMLYLLVKKLR
ncbi:MAG: permease [Campylobacterales bacterium]